MNPLEAFAGPIQALLKNCRPEQGVYLVGGAVRDLLRGVPLHDLDFALPEPVKPVARGLAAALGGALYALDEARGTYRIVETRPDSSRFTYDLAALRGRDLQADLEDRDFTLNAIAIDLRSPDQLIDPLGGAQDLHDAVLRACTPASFQNDPARVLRAVRQSIQFHLHIEKQTLSALKQAIPGLDRVSMERQRDEFMRILAGVQPAAALRILDQLGVLERLLPEIQAMKGVEQSAPHVLDVWGHTLAAVGELERVFGSLAEPFTEEKSSSLWMGIASQHLGRYRPQLTEYVQAELVADRPRRGLLMLAALLHDARKPHNRTVDEHNKVHFYNHDEEGAHTAREAARRLKLSEDEADFVARVVGGHMRVHHLAKTGRPVSRRSVYRFFQATGDAGVGVVLHSLSDTLATYGFTLPQTTWEAEVNTGRTLLEAWFEKPEESVNPPRIITGSDMIQILGLQPGPLIGRILAAITEKQACGTIVTRQQALDLATRMAAQALPAEGEADGTEAH